MSTFRKIKPLSYSSQGRSSVEAPSPFPGPSREGVGTHNVQSPVITANWPVPIAIILLVYTLVYRIHWDIAAGHEGELFPLEALSRVVAGLALLCLVPFFRKKVRTRLEPGDRCRLYWLALGFILLFTQECDWLTVIREPYLVGRGILALLVLASWLSIFSSYVARPRDLLPSAPHGREVWTLILAIMCLIISQVLDLFLDSSTYHFDLKEYDLPAMAAPIEAMLELHFLVGFFYVTLRWLATIDPRTTGRLMREQFNINLYLSLAIGIAIGFTGYQKGEPAPLWWQVIGWMIAFMGLLGFLIISRRHQLL